MGKIEKSFIGVMFLMLGLVIYHYQKDKDLHQNHNVTTGKYIKYHRGVKTGGGLEFAYSIDGESYQEICCQHLPTECEKGLVANEAALRQYTFIVVYDEKDKTNAELLVTQSRYNYFNVNVPDGIKDVVALISKCE